ncbi:hypothetical protein [Mesomycoplasma neurolyticum]|uniref:NERD domain-containing protein n=1 Tax=Mesomycoplasma neurolyticum TaxID=2120 RepID=A0A449A6A5_9BACT|nr:hypothetical protein [Mesomycoplasma neurolyticum]VEU59791.1 Uncharacterised protein [Mesomycoplasma neurolyticum]
MVIIIIIFTTISLLLFLLFFILFLLLKIQKVRKSKKENRENLEGSFLLLKKWSEKNNFIFIPKNLFKTQDGNLFFQDSILITNKFLLLIKFVNENSSIKGDVDAFYWDTGKKYEDKMRNPLFLTEKNISYVQQIIDKKIPLISALVFSKKVEDINITNNSYKHLVFIKENEIINSIEQLQQNLQLQVKTQNEILEFKKLLEKRITTKQQDFVFWNIFLTKNE